MSEQQGGVVVAEDVQESAGLPDELRDQLKTLCAKRSATYGLLSSLFRGEVSEEMYQNLKAASFPARTESDKANQGYRMIAKYLSTDHDDPLLDLAIDFVRVFIGHGNTAYSAAYPFESVYTSEKRLLMQEARDEIIRAYAEAGLVLSKDWKDPEDHIALELEYMQIMSRRAKEALEASNDDEALELLGKQKAFLLRHIVSWVPMMTSDMRRFAKTNLYQGLSFVTEGFLEQDREFLNALVQEQE